MHNIFCEEIHKYISIMWRIAIYVFIDVSSEISQSNIISIAVGIVVFVAMAIGIIILVVVKHRQFHAMKRYVHSWIDTDMLLGAYSL